MQKYIEAIIEIVLEHVTCLHQVEDEHPRGPKFDYVTYGLANEQEVIKKCLLIKPEAYSSEAQKFMKNWLETDMVSKEEMIEKSARAMHDDLYGKTQSCDYQCNMMNTFKAHVRKILEAK